MIDRLVKYKQLIEKHRRGLAIYWIDTDKEITADVVFDWLISELEKCKAEVKELKERNNKRIVQIVEDNSCMFEMELADSHDKTKKAEAEVKRLKSILAYQGTEF